MCSLSELSFTRSFGANPAMQRVVYDSRKILESARAVPCEPKDRVISLLQMGQNGKVFSTHYSVEVPDFRKAMCDAFMENTPLLDNLNLLFSAALVAQVANSEKVGKRQTLFIDLDWKPRDLAPLPFPDWYMFGYNLWQIIAKYSAVDLEDHPNRGIFFAGARFPPPDKPISLHIYFPGYSVERKPPRALKNELDEFLEPYHLEADLNVAGLKYIFCDKPLASRGIYRGDCMRPIFYGDCITDFSSSVTWQQYVMLTDPFTIPSDGREHITWKQIVAGPRALLAVEGQELSTLPDERYVKDAWAYYQAMYCPTARIGKVVLLNDVYYISTNERENVMCPHAGNNHRLKITERYLTIQCFGNDSKIAQVPVARIPIYLRSLLPETAEPLDENLAFVEPLLQYLKGFKCGIDTPITVDDFIRRGIEPPAHAIPPEYYGEGSMLNYELFSALRNCADCEDADLVQYVNLAVGHCTGGQTYALRFSSGAVVLGMKDTTIKSVLNKFQHQAEGDKRASSFWTTWAKSPSKSQRSRYVVVMSDDEEHTDCFTHKIQVRVGIYVVRRGLQNCEEQQLLRRRHTVRLWWNIYTSALCAETADDIEPFKEWISTWCGFTVHGELLPGVYLHLYDPKGGVGKSALTEIMWGLVGNDNCQRIKDMESFTGDRWGGARFSCRFASADDCAKPKAKCLPAFNELITGAQYSIEIKNGSQGNNTRNFMCLLVASNQPFLFNTTENDRRAVMVHGSRIFNGESPYKTEEAVRLFGNNHDSLIAWGRNNLTVTGRPATIEMLLLSEFLHEFYSAKGGGDACRTWMRQQIESGAMRNKLKDNIAESLYGDIGDWIIEKMISNEDHLFHLGMRWGSNTESKLRGDPNWPKEAIDDDGDPVVVEGVTDAEGRYLTIPNVTLHAAYKLWGGKESSYGFPDKVVRAFNGLCALWENDKPDRAFRRAVDMYDLEVHMAGGQANRFGYVFNFKASKKTTNCVRFDYTGVDAKLSNM